MMKIGLFDSGLGGLTILRSVVDHLPMYDYRYYGDTKNLPYGDRTEEEIYEFTKIGVEDLFASGCLLVVIACNTASAETVRRLQEELLPKTYPQHKILGIIVPTVEAMLEETGKRAVLLGTKRTVNSRKYEIELAKKEGHDISLRSIATPKLVPLIERGEIQTAADNAIETIAAEGEGSEVIVLACSHYTEIKDLLRSYFEGSKTIISQDEVIPDKLRTYLDTHAEVAGRLSQNGTRSVHLTEHRSSYDLIISQLLRGSMV